ncbi:MAG: hypothetical protein LUB61_02855 [Eggerthellaceae bacterium]|nr:hypothetical protein [Eggerthellaceae bacterium]
MAERPTFKKVPLHDLKDLDAFSEMVNDSDEAIIVVDDEGEDMFLVISSKLYKQYHPHIPAE